MLLVDTSAFVSLAIADCEDLLVEEFDVHTTEEVIDELEATAAHDDRHASAAKRTLAREDEITITSIDEPLPASSRIDAGEGSCVVCARAHGADFLITDDLRALPEVRQLVETKVALSPIVLAALVRREVLDTEEAEARLETIAESRSWLGAPIYERARTLFEDE